MVSLHCSDREGGLQEARGEVRVLPLDLAKSVFYRELHAQGGDRGELGVEAPFWEGVSWKILYSETKFLRCTV